MAQLPISENRLSKLINEWRKLLGEFDDEGLRESPVLSVKANEIAQAVWNPLKKILPGKVSGLLISPDTALWQFPFAALPGQHGSKYLIQDTSIAYAMSSRHAREMLSKPVRQPSERGSLIVGGIDHGRVILGRAGDKETIEGSRDWVTQVETKSAKAYPMHKGLVLSGDNVKAENICSELKNRYSEVILYTHGPESHATSKGRFATSVVCFPLSRSNGQTPGGPSKPYPDIFLRLDMRSTRVVWWWGCHINTGEFVPAEGVIGFPRSFLLAGAQSVLTSFVDVQTGPKSQFSKMVHQAVWDMKMEPGAAVRAIQLRWLASADNRAHPMFWSPWTVIGDVSTLTKP